MDKSIFDKIEYTLLMNGYHAMVSDKEMTGYKFMVDSSRGLVNAIAFIDAKYFNKEFVTKFRDSLFQNLKMGNINAHMMKVILIDSIDDYESFEKAKEICSEDSLAWIFDVRSEELIIFENQVEDFYGLKSLLSDLKEIPPIDKKEGFKDYLRFLAESLKALPKVTSVLVLLNIIIFILCTFTGSLYYNKGGLALSLLTEDGEFYRIITSMFLHVNITHLFGNMVLLYFLGETVEKKIGTLPFIISYVVSGIAGGIFQIIMVKNSLVIGASGAVFGILGVLLALAVFRRISKSTMSPGRIMSVIVFSVFDGFADPNIAIWAHIGGLICGLVIGVIICLISKEGFKKRDKA